MSLPHIASCRTCGSVFGEKFAYLNFGGVPDTKHRDSSPDPILQFGWHNDTLDADGKMSFPNGIIDFPTEKNPDVANGQYEINFCSIDCLRTWLNNAVDRLEAMVGKS
ncbi:MAG: hypothetical protein SGJ20_16750 [Planctomycetota bacterium]|nr:hypothetical protein [Planctomycetota bacterium]